MLIVGREVGQSVIIGNEVKVTILQIGSKLRLGIDSPKEIQISKVKQSQNSMEKFKKRTRKVVETVLIGDRVKVSVLQTESGLLRFAIDAPKEISVFREEIYINNNREFNQVLNKNFKNFDYSEPNYVI